MVSSSTVADFHWNLIGDLGSDLNYPVESHGHQTAVEAPEAAPAEVPKLLRGRASRGWARLAFVIVLAACLIWLPW